MQRLGAPKAIKAVAHKLARLIYQLCKCGEAYIEKGQADYERRQEARRLKNLQKAAAELGYTLNAKKATA